MYQLTTPSLSQTIWPRMCLKTVPQPLYSPDVGPCDFWLFPKLTGCHYETFEEMKEAVTTVIDTLTQEDFHGALQKLLGQAHWSWRRLLRRGLEFHVCTINKSVPYEKSLETYLMILVYTVIRMAVSEWNKKRY